ncbi:hypothetical protein CEK26_005376 [Fusarium fujikuroi]|nr:hypothetical protein CEK27_005380 [Fusarium fujikuroi]QGI78590.1 hypothetical protein CEK25_005319 [Fusarium fujikuroi]QGI92307.1 hypothetical protein CEK26_005376 [Fusarium fujikuroi]
MADYKQQTSARPTYAEQQTGERPWCQTLINQYPATMLHVSKSPVPTVTKRQEGELSPNAFAELQIDVVWGEQGDDIATDYVGLDPISTPLNCLVLAGTFKLRTQEARAIETDVDNSFTNNDK